jgi:hypothetical protein
MVFEYPFGRIGKFSAKEIAQVIRIDKQGLAVKIAVQLKPTPFHAIFRQRQMKAPRG